MGSRADERYSSNLKGTAKEVSFQKKMPSLKKKINYRSWILQFDYSGEKIK